ncbi:hypothetical protein PHYPSEUDO_012618 [Phytophthora pseudosyringae]|uniref:Uncharacterized protein n=1 Tax=Phytophthora pseudosyringae TaxID=221518 RepID=A0A8T1W899_9STRA|nr:hypothetical protein PHYPSEUDO_012618 [Phytophthora pseudosyringae]
MPPKSTASPPSPTPTPVLHEPYDKYRYADLRRELVARRIRLPRSGSNIPNTRVGFLKLLRDWDATDAGVRAPEPRPPTRRTSPRRTPSSPQTPTQMTSTRGTRTRRGCRFRLINVLLSPEFSRRWGEMVSRGGKMEVNRLWLDVHAAFMARKAALDTLHFQDALFVNVTPNVILPHSAARLLQMWVEIAAMYRTAVARAKEAAARNDNVHSFFDFCAGRLDLLYLHMAMLLEPKLYEFIMLKKLSAAEPFSRSKVKAAAAASSDAAVESKPEVATKAVAGKGGTSAAAGTTSAATNAATTVPALTTPTVAKSPGVLTQNPEMEEPPTPADAKGSATTASRKTAAAKANKSGIKAKQTKPAAPPYKPAPQTKLAAPTRKPSAQKKPQKVAGKAKAPASAAAAKEAKPKASPSNPKAATKTAPQKSPVDDKPAQTTSHGKRPREEENSAIVEVPTVSDIVPHPGKRLHTTTTTISTALATRSADVMLPPDEWDILESRLRKVNENIDRCHRGLASVEGGVSDSYKQSLEADLRFYSAIKQRLQEQLLVVMQSGY